MNLISLYLNSFLLVDAEAVHEAENLLVKFPDLRWAGEYRARRCRFWRSAILHHPFMAFDLLDGVALGGIENQHAAN